MYYDLIVIGAGSGGIATARRAASHGAKVLVLEAKHLGGTCVNTGCVPKKIMWNAANTWELVRATQPAAGHFAWDAIKHKRDEYVTRLNGIYEDNLRKDKIELIRGQAVLGAANEVLVDNTAYKGKHIVISTGSVPVLPTGVPGYQHGITSDDFFALSTQPKNVGIVGAGYIAVELAGIFAALGSKVTIWCRQDRILSRFDGDIAARLQEEMQRTGQIAIVRSSNVDKVEKLPDGLSIHYQVGDRRATEAVDCLLWAIGRNAKDTIKAAEFGLEMDAEGHIVVDEWQECSRKGYYAVGDVTGRFMLTPVAIAAGRRLADRLFGGKPQARLVYENIPSVVFSHPPLGTVGLSEADARARYKDGVKVYTKDFTNMFYALTPPSERPRPSLFKLITVGDNEKIVGLHIVGMGADEILQGFAVAIRMGATRADLNDTVAIHPTASEEIVYFR